MIFGMGEVFKVLELIKTIQNVNNTQTKMPSLDTALGSNLNSGQLLSTDPQATLSQSLPSR